MVRSQFKGELDILDRNTFTQATESVVNMLCKREGEVNTVLECLDVLVQVGHMWLGAAQVGSEIGSVQVVRAGVLFLAWLRRSRGKLYLR